jgi:predicted nucleotidyltransferase
MPNLDRSEIQKIVDRLVSHYSPQRVILFGSYAYGTPDADSDLDLLIVKETDKRPLDRWMEVKRLLRDRRRTVAVSPLVYTPQELERRLAMNDFFIQEILEKGQVLHG